MNPPRIMGCSTDSFIKPFLHAFQIPISNQFPVGSQSISRGPMAPSFFFLLDLPVMCREEISRTREGKSASEVTKKRFEGFCRPPVFAFSGSVHKKAKSDDASNRRQASLRAATAGPGRPTSPVQSLFSERNLKFAFRRRRVRSKLFFVTSRESRFFFLRSGVRESRPKNNVALLPRYFTTITPEGKNILTRPAARR